MRERHPSSPRAARLLLGLALSGALIIPTSGCFFGGKSDVKTSGRYIGDQTIARIEPGKTDKRWIAEVLGPPTSKGVPATNTEIWKWEYSRIKTSSGSILYAIAAGGKAGEESQIRNVYVEFDGDIVKQVWRD